VLARPAHRNVSDRHGWVSKNSGGYCESVIGYLDQQNNTMGVFYLATEMPVNAQEGARTSATITETIARNALHLN
jgi:hypothetical protein